MEGYISQSEPLIITDNIPGFSEEEISAMLSQAENYSLEEVSGGHWGSAAILLDLPEEIRAEIMALSQETHTPVHEVIARELVEHFHKKRVA